MKELIPNATATVHTNHTPKLTHQLSFKRSTAQAKEKKKKNNNNNTKFSRHRNEYIHTHTCYTH